MFRVVLIYQLVLSLLVGPMLCCCTSARLALANDLNTNQSGEPAKHSCCSSKPQKSQHQSEHKTSEPAKNKPGEPSKCPCKNAPSKELTVPVTSSVTADIEITFASVFHNLELPQTLEANKSHAQTFGFSQRSSGLSTSDLLYTHHNLRC